MRALITVIALTLLAAGPAVGQVTSYPSGATSEAEIPWTALEATGCPDSGSYEAGSVALGTDGAWCVCTVSGSPGTWVLVGPQLAADVPVADAGELLTATDVEGALAELAGSIGGAVAAEDVTVADSGELLTATDVEAALAELAGLISGTGITTATVTIPGGDGAGNVGDLFSSPVTLVAAPGAGTVLVPVFFFVFYDWASAAYDGSENTHKFVFQYADGATIAQSQNAGALAGNRPLLQATADWVEIIRPNDNTSEVGRAVVNDAIEITYEEADPYTAAGDSPLKIITGYYTLTLP